MNLYWFFVLILVFFSLYNFSKFTDTKFDLCNINQLFLLSKTHMMKSNHVNTSEPPTFSSTHLYPAGFSGFSENHAENRYREPSALRPRIANWTQRHFLYFFLLYHTSNTFLWYNRCKVSIIHRQRRRIAPALTLGTGDAQNYTSLRCRHGMITLMDRKYRREESLCITYWW